MALDTPDPQEPLDIDLLAASLRADGSEIGSFVEVIAVKLEEAVPGLVKVAAPPRRYVRPQARGCRGA